MCRKLGPLLRLNPPLGGEERAATLEASPGPAGLWLEEVE